MQKSHTYFEKIVTILLPSVKKLCEWHGGGGVPNEQSGIVESLCSHPHARRYVYNIHTTMPSN